MTGRAPRLTGVADGCGRVVPCRDCAALLIDAGLERGENSFSRRVADVVLLPLTLRASRCSLVCLAGLRAPDADAFVI